MYLDLTQMRLGLTGSVDFTPPFPQIPNTLFAGETVDFDASAYLDFIGGGVTITGVAGLGAETWTPNPDGRGGVFTAAPSMTSRYLVTFTYWEKTTPGVMTGG